MSVAFNNIPGGARVPLWYGEINAGIPPYSGLSRTIILGRKLTGGALQTLVPRNVGSTDPNYLGGKGSMLADQIAYVREHNQLGEVWAMDVGDPETGTAATGSIALTGTATAPGTLVRYIAGERYSVGVAVGDTAATVATAFAAAINKGYTKFNRRMGAPVVASAATGTVTLTARHTGTESNGLRVEAGLDGDEMDPAGLTVTMANLSGGAGDIDLAAALAALGTLAFDWYASPYNTVSHLNTVRDFLSDSGAGRWSPVVDLDGHYITVNNGNVSAQTTLGSARNDRHASIVGVLNYPHPLWSIGAALVGWVGFSKNLGRPLTEAIEIARPLHTLVLKGIRPPKAYSDRWGKADRQTLLDNGISTLMINNDGSVAIERVLTTYQTNLWGQADITFLDIETIAIAAYVKRYFRQVITSTYPRHVLRDDNPRGLQGVATVEQISNTMIHAYTDLSEIAGVVEKPDLFARYLIVERSSDPNRVNNYSPIDGANQLRIFASNITFFQELTDANASLL